MRVAIVGLRWDGTARAARTLADEGHQVTIVNASDRNDDEVPDERIDELEPVLDQVTWLQDGVGYLPALEDGGWAAVADDLPDVDAVVLGRWAGWIDAGVGEQVVQWAVQTKVPVLVLESSNVLVDTTARTFHRWIEAHGAHTLVHVIRDNDRPTIVDESHPVGTTSANALLQTLGAAGFSHLPWARLAAEGEALRKRLGIPIAGLEWTVRAQLAGGVNGLLLSPSPEALLSGQGIEWHFEMKATVLISIGRDQDGEVRAVRLSVGEGPAVCQISRNPSTQRCR